VCGPFSTTSRATKPRLSSRRPAPAFRSSTRRTSASVKQMEVALQSITQQVTHKLRLAAGKYGKPLEWHERSKEKLVTAKALNSALKTEKDEKKKTELLKVQFNIRMKEYGWARFKTAWSSAADKTVGSVKDLTARAKAMIEAEISDGLVPPSESPVSDAATKRLKKLGTLTAQAGALLAKRQSSAGEVRSSAAKIQVEEAAAAESDNVALHDANALEQPEEPPVLKGGQPPRGPGACHLPGRRDLEGLQPVAGC